MELSAGSASSQAMTFARFIFSPLFSNVWPIAPGEWPKYGATSACSVRLIFHGPSHRLKWAVREGEALRLVGHGLGLARFDDEVVEHARIVERAKADPAVSKRLVMGGHHGLGHVVEENLDQPVFWVAD